MKVGNAFVRQKRMNCFALIELLVVVARLLLPAMNKAWKAGLKLNREREKGIL